MTYKRSILYGKHNEGFVAKACIIRSTSISVIQILLYIKLCTLTDTYMNSKHIGFPTSKFTLLYIGNIITMSLWLTG